MAKQIGIILGVVFLAIGVLGFFPNPIVSENGFFATNMAHNLVHIVTAVIFIWVAAAASKNTPLTLKIFGVVYLIVALLGFWQAPDLLGFITVNAADNWLHVVLGVVIFLLGLAPAQEGSEPAAAPAGGSAPEGTTGGADANAAAPASDRAPGTPADVQAGGGDNLSAHSSDMTSEQNTDSDGEEETKQM